MAEIIATIVGGGDDLRARVVRLGGGAFAVEVQRLFDATDAGGESNGQFWGTVGYPRSYFDSESQAAEFAVAVVRDEPDAAPGTSSPATPS